MNSTTINFCSNPSSNSVTAEYWELSSFSANGQMAAAFILFFIVVGLPWNIMVVITIIKKRLYHQPTIMLLLNLVVADILMILIYFPIVTVTGFAGEYIFGSTDMIRCQTSKFIQFVAISLIMDSLFVVALISFDRFLFIYKPLHYEQKANKRRTLMSIASTSILSIAIGFITLIIPTINDADMFHLINIKIYPFWYIIFLITFSCMALAVIIVSNIWVIYIVQKNIKEVFERRRLLCGMEKRKSYFQDLSERVREERHKKQLHLFRVFGGLLLSNTIAWFPIILVYVLDISKVNLTINYFYVTDVLFLSQVAIHPILETTLIADVREPLKEMVTCGLLKKKKDDLDDRTGEQILSYCLSCRSAEVYDDNHCSCSFMFKLIDAAVLPKNNSSSSRASAQDSGEKPRDSESLSSNGYIL